ncbi:MAG: glycosyltransferase, partial [Gemmatimonadota bacterium]|nr:glycosyltransferase [Gemmatimonadota bacterium]
VDAAYIAVLALLLPFGAHRLRLLWLRARRPPRCEVREWDGPLPRVTVQLPVYNEANVVERLIDAACSLDYPRDLLEVQVLDDSDDDTARLAAAHIALWRARGVDVSHVRRGSRSGFKAGALENGTRLACGEFMLVLDADFVPPRSLVRDLLGPFADPGVGAVQAAWDHLSPDASWLTRAQALFLDAHFAIEHEARYRAGLFFNFNGSAGMWRRACVGDAGGWSADTLTEDVDLSYRAQLAGWRFAYLDDVRVPAELPRRLRAVEIQQERWTQGGVESARKLLPAVWRSGAVRAQKIEATAHLLGHTVHPLTLLLGAALAITGLLGLGGAAVPAWMHLTAIAFATIPFALFYGSAAAIRGVPIRALPRRVGEAMLLGLGLGVPLTGAVLRGALGRRTPFERTPKEGSAGRVVYRAAAGVSSDRVRAALGLVLVAAALNLAFGGVGASVPFTALFAAGYVAASLEALCPRLAMAGSGTPSIGGG